jgi:hypothetical protein
MRRCDQCQHFSADPSAGTPEQIIISGDGIRGGGECRRHPPRDPQKPIPWLAEFPVVACEWWCGEFQPRTA